MKSLSSFTTQHKNQRESEHPWIWLFEFQTSDDPPQRFRLTNYDQLVQFGEDSSGAAIDYYPAAIMHGSIAEESDGSLPSIEVFVAMTGLTMATTLDQQGGLVGNPARIWLVSSLELSNTAAGIRLDGEVISTAMTPEVITLSVAAHNVYREKLPPFLYTKRHCRWIFGSTECGYVLSAPGAGFETCPRTLAACKERGDDEEDRGLTRLHPQRFGGFPGIPPLARGA